LEAAEEELRERSVAAEVASAEKTRLIAAVGHDLRQPMMAASLYLSVLEGRMAARDERGAEKQLANVQESLRALGDTLEHLLTAARYETGNYPLRMETVSLHELLSRVLETCGAGATARGVSLVVRRPEDAVQVRTDRQTALLVLTNLVSNAVKFADYSKPRPRVVIRRVRRGGQCQITVLDNGIGIAATDLERIWRPFFQVSNSERNREAGMGLGLYLVQRAVAQLPQHEVSVRSILGHGTMFRLTVPIVAGDVGEASAQSARPVPAGSLAGTYVLIVEDDVQARDALQAILRDWGADYASGATLDDAMLGAHGTGRHVDVLLVDYRLPNGVRGDQVIREARERLGYEACAVLVTAEAHQADSLEDCLPSATKLLRKPFSTSALAFALSEADRSSA
jgi:nitrogen-specific signal transduction histidine kinase/CheY-like chemotaxis protein